MSKYPVNPRNRALSSESRNPLQVWVRNPWIRAKMPLNSSSHPKTSTVAKVALTSPITQTTPRIMNRIPRARNQPQELRISSTPAASGLSENSLTDIVFLLFFQVNELTELHFWLLGAIG